MPKGIYVRTTPAWNKGTKGVVKSWNKGKKGLQVAWNKGLKCPQISKAKMGEKNGMFGKISWNKGTKGVMKPNRTSFLKGHIPSFKGKKCPKRSGEKCHLWKGGITPENIKIRHSIEFNLWHEAVFARDNWTCQKTGIKGGDIHAHHIQNFAQFPELRFAIDNGITLSKKAHKEFHKIYGNKNNNKEQLIEFLKT